MAILLIGIALILSTAFLNAMTRSSERLQLQVELLRHCEATIESVRSGALPLTLGFVSLDPISTNIRDTQLNIDVVCRTTSTQDLYAIEVQTRCSVRGQPLQRSLETLLWRP